MKLTILDVLTQISSISINAGSSGIQTPPAPPPPTPPPGLPIDSGLVILFGSAIVLGFIAVRYFLKKKKTA